MESKKLVFAVIGGASIFTPELIDYLIGAETLLGDLEIRLMDIEPENLAIIQGICNRLISTANSKIRILPTSDYESAVAGADFVLLQFRIGGADARIVDESLGAKYRIPFVETVSVCGFATFLRTYYELPRLVQIIKEQAPQAWVMCFANPAGLVSEAVSRLGVPRVVGVCNASTTFLNFVRRKLGLSEEQQIFMNWRGLNHLTFTDSIMVDGVDLLQPLLASLADYESERVPFPKDLLQQLGFIPNQYLQYYYLKEDIIAKQQQQPELRSRQVKRINEQLLERYKTLSSVPEELKQRGGAGYSKTVVDLICSMVSDNRQVHYLVAKNSGAIAGIPDDSFAEMPCIVLSGSVHPIKVSPLPNVAHALVRAMKAYELELLEAAEKESREGLLQALLLHPLIGSYSLAKPLLEDVLKENAEYLPVTLRP